MLFLAGAATAWGIGFAAAPAVAEPADTPSGPTTDEFIGLPAASVVEGMWREYVPANAVPQGPIGQVDQLIEQFLPTTTQVRDFFVFIQQFRPPAPIIRPTG